VWIVPAPLYSKVRVIFAIRPVKLYGEKVVFSITAWETERGERQREERDREGRETERGERREREREGRAHTLSNIFLSPCYKASRIILET